MSMDKHNTNTHIVLLFAYEYGQTQHIHTQITCNSFQTANDFLCNGPIANNFFWFNNSDLIKLDLYWFFAECLLHVVAMCDQMIGIALHHLDTHISCDLERGN